MLKTFTANAVKNQLAKENDQNKYENIRHKRFVLVGAPPKYKNQKMTQQSVKTLLVSLGAIINNDLPVERTLDLRI